MSWGYPTPWPPPQPAQNWTYTVAVPKPFYKQEFAQQSTLPSPRPRSTCPTLSNSPKTLNPQKPSTVSHAGLSGLSFLSAALLKQLPAINRPGSHWFPSDWKLWGKVGLGVFGTHQLNKALNWQPPPWLNGIETVVLMHPLLSGFTKQGLAQLCILAPMVGGMVYGATLLSQKVAKPLKERFDISPTATKLVLGLGLGLVGTAIFPKLYKPLLKTGWFGAVNQKQVGSGLMAGAVTCLRGCTPGGVVCLSELGEIMGGMVSPVADEPTVPAWSHER